MVTFRPIELSGDKLVFLADLLLADAQYFSDEHRTPPVIWACLANWFGESGTAVGFDIMRGDANVGCLVFRDIVPGHKANIFFIVWDKEGWGLRAWRSGAGVMETVMNEFGLNKIEVETANRSWAGFMEKNGFELEGTRHGSYLKNGEPQDQYLLAIYREG
jgi:RimJ/RimL family protein N-acetyltransferase